MTESRTEPEVVRPEGSKVLVAAIQKRDERQAETASQKQVDEYACYNDGYGDAQYGDKTDED